MGIPYRVIARMKWISTCKAPRRVLGPWQTLLIISCDDKIIAFWHIFQSRWSKSRLRNWNSLGAWEAACSTVVVLVTQLCPTLCDPMDCSPAGSSVQGILQARTLEWVAISFSRESFPLRDQTWVSSIAGRFFTVWATRKVQCPHQWDLKALSLTVGLGTSNVTLQAC